jgi:hypothetical protein
MQQQQQPGGPVPTYRNVQGVRTEPPNQRTTYNVQRTTYGTYNVLDVQRTEHPWIYSSTHQVWVSFFHVLEQLLGGYVAGGAQVTQYLAVLTCNID